MLSAAVSSGVAPADDEIGFYAFVFFEIADADSGDAVGIGFIYGILEGGSDLGCLFHDFLLC